MLPRSIKALAGLLIGLAIPAVANAYPAWSTGGSSLRAGPGAAFPKVGYLPGGQRVEVFTCSYGWCQVQYGGYGGYSGWVISGRLTTYAPRFKSMPPPGPYMGPPGGYMMPPPPPPPPPMGYPPPPPMKYKPHYPY